MSHAVQDLQKKVEAQGKDIQDTKTSLQDTKASLEETEKALQATQRALMKYERTLDAHTIELRSTVLDKWAGKHITSTRRSRRNAAAHGGSILADL
jgi:peptidoglycan hydrolase CwlO-like protein